MSRWFGSEPPANPRGERRYLLAAAIVSEVNGLKGEAAERARDRRWSVTIQCGCGAIGSAIHLFSGLSVACARCQKRLLDAAEVSALAAALRSTHSADSPPPAFADSFGQGRWLTGLAREVFNALIDPDPEPEVPPCAASEP